MQAGDNFYYVKSRLVLVRGIALLRALDPLYQQLLTLLAGALIESLMFNKSACMT